jgi:major vault protein
MEEEKAEDHKGASDLQLIKSQIIAQKERIKLIELQTKSMSVESSGKAVAEAKAIAERIKIKGEAEESKSKLQVEARKVTELSELDMLKKKNATEIEKLTAMNNLEITTKQKLADIEVSKFENMMDALGKDTIVAMAKSGPETQSKLLKGLGLQGFMVVDGKNPINLMGIAQGMIGKPEEKSN